MTGFNGASTWRPGFTLNELEREALALWSVGNDTLEIARRLATPESEIAYMLPRLLEQRRQDREWNFDTLVGARR